MNSLGNASFLPNVGDTRSLTTGCPIHVYPALASIPIIYRVGPPINGHTINECLLADYCTFKVRHNKPLIQTTQTITQQVTNLLMSFDVDIESYASSMHFLPSSLDTVNRSL